MRMIAAALIGGALIGFVAHRFLDPEITKHIARVETQSLAAAGVAAFLGALWGWVAKGVLGSKVKD